jgi:hypothetical protein
MTRIINMEEAHQRMQSETDRLVKKCAALSEQIREAHQELRGRMGWDDQAEAKAMIAERYR